MDGLEENKHDGHRSLLVRRTLEITARVEMNEPNWHFTLHVSLSSGAMLLGEFKAPLGDMIDGCVRDHGPAAEIAALENIAAFATARLAKLKR
jgi:hypothetical protein